MIMLPRDLCAQSTICVPSFRISKPWHETLFLDSTILTIVMYKRGLRIYKSYNFAEHYNYTTHKLHKFVQGLTLTGYSCIVSSIFRLAMFRWFASSVLGLFHWAGPRKSRHQTLCLRSARLWAACQGGTVKTWLPVKTQSVLQVHNSDCPNSLVENLQTIRSGPQDLGMSSDARGKSASGGRLPDLGLTSAGVLLAGLPKVTVIQKRWAGTGVRTGDLLGG